MGNPVVHFEIAGRDGEKLEEFYRTLFGWAIERQDIEGQPYGMIQAEGEGRITGGIRHEPEGEAEVVLYVEVEDLMDAVAEAQRLGGEVRIPPMETPVVTFAMVTDPEGNPVGMVHKK
jgi:predicted enzyme related to lactoylglutathione lyase